MKTLKSLFYVEVFDEERGWRHMPAGNVNVDLTWDGIVPAQVRKWNKMSPCAVRRHKLC